MSKKTKLIYEIIIILICIGIVFCLLQIRKNVQTTKLKKEIHEVANKDLGSYKFDGEVKCSGGYGKVEESIKVFLSNYAKDMNDVNNIMSDKKILNILSIDNYKKDAPEFKTSLDYLDKKEKEYIDKINNLIKSSDEEYINNYIYKNIKDRRYIKLYRSIIKKESISQKLSIYKDSLINHKEKVSTIFSNSKAIIKLLRDNKGKWKIDGKQIKFANSDLLNKYNEALKNINK